MRLLLIRHGESEADILNVHCTLKRAKETAEYLANELHQGIIEDELLMEFNNGDIAGLSREEARVRFPEIKNLPIHEAVYH